MSLYDALELNAKTTLALIAEYRRVGLQGTGPSVPITDVVDTAAPAPAPVRVPATPVAPVEPFVPVTPVAADPTMAPGPNVPVISGIVPQNDCPGVRLDMSKATPGRRLPAINQAGPQSNAQVPRGYVLAAVQSPGEGQYLGMNLVEHGGATLLADSKGRAKYVLGCGHVPTAVDPVTGEFSSIASEYRLSIRPNSRAQQPLVFACDEVYTHPWYEGSGGTYRWDLSLSVLPEPVDIAHAISRHDMSMHRVDAGEELTYCGFGSKEKHGQLHETIHFGRMKATDRSRDHITEMVPIDDQFEQGFSGGPFYSTNQQMAWSGVTSHYVELGGDNRKSYIIPASVALPWADAMITWIMDNE